MTYNWLFYPENFQSKSFSARCPTTRTTSRSPQKMDPSRFEMDVCGRERWGHLRAFDTRQGRLPHKGACRLIDYDSFLESFQA
ncbi:hypothetical protein Mapa_008330 [Marchantia paleacea]|nr:hypothetical protein Mapa_008330 [Marchantia paleacea]